MTVPAVDILLRQVVACENLLREHATKIQVVATTMAYMKSMVVYGEPGHYNGRLGGPEMGVDTIFLEHRGSFNDMTEEQRARALEFDHDMDHRVADLLGEERLIHVDGYF